MGALDGSAIGWQGMGWRGLLLHVMDGSVVAHHFSSPYMYELPLK